MCFDIKSKVKIAEKDITCYKFVRKGGRSIHYPLLVIPRGKTGPGKKQEWKTGYHYTEQNFPKWKTTNDTIDGSAFHSFRGISNIKGYYPIKSFSYGYEVIECTIPKGSYYYANRTQYCSSDIICKKFMGNPLIRKPKKVTK